MHDAHTGIETVKISKEATGKMETTELLIIYYSVSKQCSQKARKSEHTEREREREPASSHQSQ